MAADLLDVYLSDHFAGATGGHELAQRIVASHPGNDELALVAREVAEDRQALREVMAAVSVEVPALKSIVSWLGERAARLKFNDRLFGRSPLSSVIELEGMIVGISGKLQLWRGLAIIAPEDPRLSRFDFDALAARAESQRARLERQHAAAVNRSLADR
jgi:hypothetical protein